jgi:ElaB/YqjD/DUF883 family membrane-anchored ribosome-binding protein
MFRFSLVSLIKFLVGIILLQGVTALLVFTALKSDLPQTWPLFAALGGTVGVLVALWFTSIADSARHQSLAKAKESFSREREKIRVRAEQDKAKEVKNTQRAAAKAQRFAGLAISPKTGIAIGGAVGLGVAMMVAQFVTMGFLTLAAAGGAVLGYGARVRQERYGGNLLGGGDRREVQVLEAQTATLTIEPQRRRPRAIPGKAVPQLPDASNTPGPA